MSHRISLLVVVAFVATSCGGSDARRSLTEPTPFAASQSSVSVTTTAANAVAEPVSNPFCPSVAPFSVPLVIVVGSNDSSTVVVTAIRMQFFDLSGSSMPQVTLPAPVPTTQIGLALTNARSAQAFPVSMGIGCGTGHKGNVRIVVETRDAQGRTGSAQTVVGVS
jgi:hypothetical protein